MADTKQSAKKKAKAAYDRARCKRLGESLRAKRRAAYALWGPAHRQVERQLRQKRMPQHIEYCRQPAYRKLKEAYDRKRRSARYGEFAEAHAILIQLRREIRKQMPDRFERYAQAQRKGWSPLEQAKRREKRANERIITIESICG